MSSVILLRRYEWSSKKKCKMPANESLRGPELKCWEPKQYKDLRAYRSPLNCLTKFVLLSATARCSSFTAPAQSGTTAETSLKKHAKLSSMIVTIATTICWVLVVRAKF